MNKLKNIGTAIAFLGIAVAVVDLLNAGAFVFSDLTNIPLEAIPTEAPNWVRYSYLASIVVGFSIRYITIGITNPNNT